MDNATTRTIGLVIPTLNAGIGWEASLAAVSGQSVRPLRSLVVDSSSVDCTREKAEKAGFEVVKIARSQFNHGGTRQWAAEQLADCEVVVFLTQDAILAKRDAVEQLVRCFDDPRVAVAYGRQLPHVGATFIEAHSRIFNYGPSTLFKDAAASRKIGTKAFFCSNSFAAYRRSTLLELGGFRANLILGEDMEFAARALRAGYANVYCATSEAFHSHDYTLIQTLERYFDIGVFDEKNSWMRQQFGSHSGEGARFVSSELRYLLTHSPLQIPIALFLTAAKFAGYRLGRMQRWLPNALRRKLSMSPGYWS